MMLLKSSLLLFVFSIFLVQAKAQDFVGSIKASLDRGQFLEAQAKLKQYRDSRGVTPEYLEAYSWLGRTALARNEFKTAQQYAAETYKLSAAELKKRALDAEPRLPTALGAAIEVEAQAMAGGGDRAQAIQYLTHELHKYSKTSIAARIRKNLNLLSLEGKVAPALVETSYLGMKPPTLASLHGKAAVLFFWAHWCVDCKAEVPILARLKQEFRDKLAIIGPTQLYGYAGNGTEASPQVEMQYIDAVRQRYFASLADMPVPVAAENFVNYGASTTPTLVLVGRDGQVKLYHPGRMTYEELRGPIVAASYAIR
jgi:thiol-disulfide isomerase/thioredoxin